MNKLLDADNIKHHKKVYVNKMQRKKVNTIVNKIAFMFINVIDVVAAYYDNLAARRGMRGWHYHFSHYFDTFYKYQHRSHKIIWDDANKTSARIMIKTANGYRFIKDRYNEPKHFSREYLFKQYN